MHFIKNFIHYFHRKLLQVLKHHIKTHFIPFTFRYHLLTHRKMSQVKSGVCLPWNAPRTHDHFWGSPFTGTVSTVDYAIVNCNDPPRREDRLPQKYGSGTPAMNSTKTDVWGISKGAALKDMSDTFQTMNGPISLPRHVPESSGYLPTVATLDAITRAQDTRRLAPPTRYYK